MCPSVLSGCLARKFLVIGNFRCLAAFSGVVRQHRRETMARRGRPTVEIKLSADERKTLQRWGRRQSSWQALAMRCRIVLACADRDRTRADIAAAVGCNPVTVTKWRQRFAQDRLDGLVDAPGLGRKARSATTSSRPWSSTRSRPARRTRRISRLGSWPKSMGSHITRWPRSGRRSVSSRGAKTSSRSPRTHSSSRRSVTSSACTSALRSPRWCSVSTKSRRSKHSTGPRRRCRCCPPPRPGPAMTTNATAPSTCSLRSTSPPGP